MEKINIALIAHDGKKANMVAFVMENIQYFKNDFVSLVATGTTGSFIEDAGLTVTKVASGPMGGDAQIASMVVEKTVQMVIFFRDPLGKHPHDVDVSMLMRVCDVHNCPLATNPASALLLLKGIRD